MASPSRRRGTFLIMPADGLLQCRSIDSVRVSVRADEADRPGTAYVPDGVESITFDKCVLEIPAGDYSRPNPTEPQPRPGWLTPGAPAVSLVVAASIARP